MNSNIFLLIASICVSSTIFIMYYSLTQAMFRASVLLVFALSPWLQKHFTEYKEAVKVEKHHWKHDKDLQRIQKIRYGLWLVYCVVYAVFTLQNLKGEFVYECMRMFAHEIYAEGFFFFKIAYCVFALNLLIRFVWNVHIALFRNPLTPGFVNMYRLCACGNGIGWRVLNHPNSGGSNAALRRKRCCERIEFSKSHRPWVWLNWCKRT